MAKNSNSEYSEYAKTLYREERKSVIAKTRRLSEQGFYPVNDKLDEIIPTVSEVLKTEGMTPERFKAEAEELQRLNYDYENQFFISETGEGIPEVYTAGEIHQANRNNSRAGYDEEEFFEDYCPEEALIFQNAFGGFWSELHDFESMRDRTEYFARNFDSMNTTMTQEQGTIYTIIMGALKTYGSVVVGKRIQDHPEIYTRLSEVFYEDGRWTAEEPSTRHTAEIMQILTPDSGDLTELRDIARGDGFEF